MNIDDRMKFYEDQECNRVFLPYIPIIVRLDGRAFHTFTKDLKRPFDSKFCELMDDVTKFLLEETNAVIAYVQSDEISLILLQEQIESELYFSGRAFKISTILASLASVKFNQLLLDTWPVKSKEQPVFDCRIFQVPNKTEAVNYLIWREQDAVRNSINMAGRAYFSHNQMMNKNVNEVQEMLFQQHNINWNDYADRYKRGSYFRRKIILSKFTEKELSNLPEKHHARKDPNLMVERKETICLDLPILTKIKNREEVIFDQLAPEI